MFNNKSIDAYCRTLDSNNFEELKSELIMQLYKMDITKIITYDANNCLTYICFTIIKRIKFGTIADTGFFYKNEKFDELTSTNIPVVESTDWQEIENNLDSIKAEIASKHWYDRTLFEMYYYQEMTLKEISLQTGINLKSVHYCIKKTRMSIKKKLNKND